MANYRVRSNDCGEFSDRLVEAEDGGRTRMSWTYFPFRLTEAVEDVVSPIGDVKLSNRSVMELLLRDSSGIWLRLF